MFIERKAPGKINWFLEVLAKRDDGYHEIDTVMQKIEWCDLLTFQLRDDGEIRFSCTDPALPTNENNLVLQAAAALKRRCENIPGADINLKKNLPVGAGLGGGSSDAATTLMALNDLWGLGLLDSEMTEIAAAIGSDVAFFLNGSWARCTGRGEIVSALEEPARSVPLVVIWPGQGANSSKVYKSGAIDLTTPRLECNFSNSASVVGFPITNRLEPASALCFEFVSDAISRAREIAGGKSISMSGSGSALFVVCANDNDAERLVMRFRDVFAAPAVVQATRTIV